MHVANDYQHYRINCESDAEPLHAVHRVRHREEWRIRVLIPADGVAAESAPDPVVVAKEVEKDAGVMKQICKALEECHLPGGGDPNQ